MPCELSNSGTTIASKILRWILDWRGTGSNCGMCEFLSLWRATISFHQDTGSEIGGGISECALWTSCVLEVTSKLHVVASHRWVPAANPASDFATGHCSQRRYLARSNLWLSAPRIQIFKTSLFIFLLENIVGKGFSVHVGSFWFNAYFILFNVYFILKKTKCLSCELFLLEL